MDSKSNGRDDILQADDSKTLVGLITSGNHSGVVDFLQKKNASVNIGIMTFLDEKTFPLHVAVDVKRKAYHHDLFMYFISEGADCNIHDSRGYAPLHYAAIHNNIAATKALLDSGANVNIQLDFPSKKSELITSSLKAEEKVLTYKTQMSPLHVAVLSSCGFVDDSSPVDLVQILLSHGAACNHVDESGSSPLHYAVIMNAIPTARMLLEAGADPNIQCQEGYYETPLFLAKGVPMLKLLLSRNADVYDRLWDCSLLDWSLNSLRHDIARYLITEFPGLLYTENDDGQSPLTVAVNRYNFHRDPAEFEGVFESLKLMVRAGCEPVTEMLKLKDLGRLFENRPEVSKFFNRLEEMISNPRPLTVLCSIKVRSFLKRDVARAVETLRLPTKIKEILTSPYLTPDI